jgi:cell division protease FtsH
MADSKQSLTPNPERGKHADASQSQPWRTEGLPPKQAPKQRPRWIIGAVLLLGYLLIFGIITMQDRLNGPQSVSYTELKTQVSDKNVAEVFARGDSIQGSLKKAVPLPSQKDSTYQQFTTERPTFASDNLLQELTESQSTVRATPLVQERGFLTNILVPMAPFLLLVALWMFKRQKAAMGGGLFGDSPKKPVDRETVRFTFNDVAGIDEVEAENNEVVDFLLNPEKYRRLGVRAPRGVLLSGPPGTGKTLGPTTSGRPWNCGRSFPIHPEGPASGCSPSVAAVPTV